MILPNEEKLGKMSKQSIRIKPVSSALGAEISGVDLGDELSDQTIAEIRTALCQNLVIFFHDQGHITPTQQAGFAERFGALVDYPLMKGLEEAPHVVPVVKLPEERINFGGLLHADTTYLNVPPMGSILLARELPPEGGDTEFANMYMAYEQLSPAYKEFLDGLTVVNTSAKVRVSDTRKHRVAEQDEPAAPKELIAEHPAVCIHPETGRKALFVNFAHTVRFKELSIEESEPILDYLFAHLSNPEFTYRFQWSEGSIAFWDNLASQHNPLNDYHGHKRVMHRVTIAGR
jgi:taurine dioxygenase